MKKILTLFILLFSLGAISQNGINYKAIINDANGNVVTNQLVAVQFTILQGAEQTVVYQETHTPTTNDKGHIILVIGEGFNGNDYTGINWASDDHFLNVQIDLGGGFTDLGTTQFMHVPYAIQAENAKNATNVNGLEAIDEGNGLGWRLIGRNPDYYGNIGYGAVDFTENDSESSTIGAIGSNSVAIGVLNSASGDYSVSLGLNTRASGNGSFAAGRNVEAFGNYSFAFGDGAESVSNTSIAIGANALAFGPNSVAIGSNTSATGNNAIALGTSSEASGTYSFATGNNTSATENYSTAMGRNTFASGESSIAMGYNVLAAGESSIAMGDNTSAMENYSTAMGRVTLASGESSTAMGHNTAALGESSIAMGFDTEASGRHSTAMGRSTEALGESSIAMGNSTEASGDNSTAMGSSATASGDNSTAMGNSTEASGDNSTAMGINTEASGNGSVAMGINTEASGNSSVAMGRTTRAPSFVETVIGYYNLDYTPSNNNQWNLNDRLFVIGNGTSDIQRSNAVTVLKNGNVGIGTHAPQESLHVNGIVRIGSETIEDTGSNRLSFNADLLPDLDNVMRLGNSDFQWVGVWATDGTINTSDRRSKTNITDLSYGLKDILKLNPVSFNWKTNPNDDTKLGLIAQDLLEVIPEVVKTHDWEVDEEGNKIKKELERMGVYYSDLVPVLIKAIQEQQDTINNQSMLISNLSENYENVKKLNTRVKQLEALLKNPNDESLIRVNSRKE